MSAESSRNAVELRERSERMAEALWRLWRGGYIDLADLDAVKCRSVADAMASAAGEPRRSTETPCSACGIFHGAVAAREGTCVRRDCPYSPAWRSTETPRSIGGSA